MGNDYSSPFEPNEQPKQTINHKHLDSSTYKCDSCNKIMHLCCTSFYHQDPINKVIEECLYRDKNGKKQIKILRQCPCSAIEKKQNICKECFKNVIEKGLALPQQTSKHTQLFESEIYLSDPLPLEHLEVNEDKKGPHIYTCTECDKKTHLESFAHTPIILTKKNKPLCENCYSKYCCYEDCNRNKVHNCPVCYFSICAIHYKRHMQTLKHYDIGQEVEGYSCNIAKINLNLKHIKE